MGPMHGMYGTLDPGLEVQRTIKRADLTAFIRHFRRRVDPTTVHVDNKGIINGLWRGEIKCIGPEAKDADLWLCIWEEVRRIHQEGALLEVEHVKARRSKKEKPHKTEIIPRRRFCRKSDELKNQPHVVSRVSLEGIPASNLWDTLIDISHRQAGGDSKLVHQTQTPKHHDPFGDIDDVPPNARLFCMRTAENIFKDHEADLVMWARQEECQELRKVIKYMSERQEKFLGQGCKIEEGMEKHRLYHCSCRSQGN